MDSSIQLDIDQGEPFHDVGCYQCLVGKLIYLTVTHPDITYVMGFVSQYLHAPRHPHFETDCRTLCYFKECSWPWVSMSVF